MSQTRAQDQGAAQISSEDLAWQAARGCQASFAALVARHAPSLELFLRRRVSNTHDAEDLVQETFVKAYENIADYRDTWRFSTWLHTIALQLAITHHRKAQVRCAEATMPEADAAPGPSDVADAREQHETLWALARDLPAGQYEALWLRYGRDLSVKEIARTMKRSQVGVKVLLYRARTALAQQWREAPEDVR